MTIDVAVSEVIERPVEVVVAFVLDPANARRWSRLIQSAEWTTDPPTRLGSRICYRRTGRAGSHVDEYEVCEFDLPDQVALRTVDAKAPMTTTYTWRPVGDRVTHMTLRNTTDGGGVSAVLRPLSELMLRRSMMRDLRVLKRVIESS